LSKFTVIFRVDEIATRMEAPSPSTQRYALFLFTNL